MIQKYKRIPAVILALLIFTLAFPFAAFAYPIEDAGSPPSAGAQATPTTISVPESAGQEFSIDGGTTWQSSGTFTGLTPDTEYRITARYAETEDTMPSPASDPLVVRTKAASVSVETPSAPELISRTDSKVVIKSEAGKEYSKDGGKSWQDSGVFDGLKPNTSYEFVVRVKETESAMPSASSPALFVTTKKSSPSAPATAPEILEKTDTSLTVKTEDGQEYSIDNGKIWQDGGTFEGLDPDEEYEVITRVKETEESMPSAPSASTPVSTKKSAPKAPAAPELESRSDTEIQVKAVQGQEYSANSGEDWQANPKFAGLEANAKYSIVARVAETEDTMPSPMSAALETSTKTVPADVSLIPPKVLGTTTSSIRYEVADGQEYALRRAAEAKAVLALNESGENGYVCGWQTSGEFSGLTSGTKYEIVTRLAETDDTVASEIGTEAVTVTTGRPSNPAKTETHTAYAMGYPDGTIRPEAAITREEAAQLLFRLMDNGELCSRSVQSFSDVPNTRWSFKAISCLAEQGILKGYNDGSFHPGDTITRAEFAAMVSRWKSAGESETIQFSDISGHWAEAEIRKAATYGWIKGYEDGTFRPDESITRAEVFSLVNRVLGRNLTSKDDLTGEAASWSDVSPDAWYYLDVLEATTDHEAKMYTSGEVWK